MKCKITCICLLILIISLTSCNSNSSNDNNNVDENSSSQNDNNISNQTYEQLEYELTALLEGKSFIRLCSVDVSQSSAFDNKIKFDIIIIGNDLESNINEIMDVFTPNSHLIDFSSCTIKDDTGLQLYPNDTTTQFSTQTPNQAVAPTISSGMEIPIGNISDWNLILLNHDAENKINAELNFEQVKFDTQFVDSRAGVFYQQMYNDALKDGITLYLRSGYRSISTQTVNYNANVERLVNLGNSRDEAIKQTNLYYTVPGHSEHHTGLAFDIITPEYHNDVYTLSEEFAKTDAYDWLIKNCANYGFILRYAEDKTNITAINFEPWHYRYVGVEHAQFITANNICLEEYIALLKENGR